MVNGNRIKDPRTQMGELRETSKGISSVGNKSSGTGVLTVLIPFQEIGIVGIRRFRLIKFVSGERHVNITRKHKRLCHQDSVGST